MVQWTAEMTVTCLRGLTLLATGWAAGLGIAVGAGLPLTAGQVQGLVEHGERGMSALWIVVVVVPLIGSTYWVIVRLLGLLKWQLQEAGLERNSHAEAFERFVRSQTDALVENTRSLQKVCANLERRPCIAGDDLEEER